MARVVKSGFTWNHRKNAKSVSKQVDSRGKHWYSELMSGTNGKARLLGITDEITTCDCCGKANLKRTLALSLDGESDAVHFGSTCGARALAGRGYTVKKPQLERRADKLAFEVRMRDYYVAALEQVEGMMKAGQVRWIIGGVEKGAPLAQLADSYQRSIDSYGAKISALEVL